MDCKARVNIAVVYHHSEPDWMWNPAPFVDFDLWLICDGQGKIKYEENTFEISRGDCFLFQPGMTCTATCGSRASLTLIAVHFDLFSQNGRKMTKANISSYRKVANASFLTHILERVISAWKDGNKSLAATWLKSALLEIDGKQPPEWIVSPGPKGGYFWKIDELCEKINLHPDADWSVQNMADRLNLCRNHFTRIFRTFKNCSPIEFITRTRIDAVKHLLASSHYTLGEIMEMTGYKSFSFFSRQFKEQTGITPSKFREKFMYLKKNKMRKEL